MHQELETEIRSHFDAGELELAATVALQGYGPELLGYLVATMRDEQAAGEVKAEAEKEAEEIEDYIGEWIQTRGKKQLWGPRLLMLAMVARDLIPEGDYVIDVFW